LPAGASVVTTLASSPGRGPDRLERFYSHTPGEHHAFATLSGVFADRHSSTPSPGTTVDEPIQLVFFSRREGVPLMSSPRSVIIADADSRATIIETYARYQQRCLLHQCRYEEVIAATARKIDHYKVQNRPVTAFHLALDVSKHATAEFSPCLIMLSSSIARHEVPGYS
jgi:Fe-S cluster assembly protein SufD